MNDHLHDALVQTKEAYDQVAQLYEQATLAFHQQTSYPCLRDLLKLSLGDIKELKILDVGCGAGGLMQFLEGEGAICTGLDLSSSFVQIAQERGLDVYEGSMHQLPFAQNSFDAVVENFVFNYLPPDTQKIALREKCRVLKPGGILAFCCMHPSLMRMQYTAESACDLVSPDYFHPQRVHSVHQFGQTFVLHLLDYPELVNLVIESGFILQGIFDATAPRNIEQFISHAPLRALAQSMMYNPYGLYVLAYKPT